MSTQTAPQPASESYRFEIDGREVTIPRLPPGEADLPSSLAFSLHKSGSTLLQKILVDLSPHAGVTFFAFDSLFWDQGVAPGQVPPTARNIYQPRGYCYGVFRTFPWKHDIPILETAPRILLVRDPRDALVSHYFSVAKSHPIPKGAPLEVRQRLMRDRAAVNASAIDDHVLEQADFFHRVHWRYWKQLVQPGGVKVYRYEDIIFAKRAWVDDICQTLGWDVPRSVRHEVADRHDQRPRKEDASAHVRRVTPGDHREKLRPETIRKLDEILGHALDRYGYERFDA